MTQVKLLDYRTETNREGLYATGFAGVRITAPASIVWELISDWSGQQRLMPNEILNVATNGDGTRPGDTRTLAVSEDLLPHSVSEILEHYDEERRRYAYSVVDGGGTPWARYYGEFEVLANGPNECLVSYVCKFIPLTGDHLEAAESAVSSCEIMFENIVKLLSESLNSDSGE